MIMVEPRMIRDEIVVDEHGEKIDKYGKVILTRFFADPDGKTRDFLLWGGKVAPAIILVVTAAKKVMALRIFRRAANKSIIEIPGGNPKAGEKMEDCALREILEETGCIPKKLIHIGPSIWFDPASCIIPFEPYLALGCKQTREQEISQTEIQEGTKIIPLRISEWIKMIYRGEVPDSKSIAVTFLAIPHLGVRTIFRIFLTILFYSLRRR
jgi:ADP-ribose pyrophosphatase